METWTPTQADLENCQHIVLTLPHPWNPSEINFPMTTEGDREEIENRNIGAMKLVKGQSQEGGSGGLLEYTDPYLQPVRYLISRRSMPKS